MLNKITTLPLALIASIFTAVLFVSPVMNAEESVVDKQLAEHHGDGHHKKGKFMKRYMKKMDVDGDGKVSKDEFMKNAEEKFSKKDKNGDGFISEDEMKRQCDHKKKSKQEA